MGSYKVINAIDKTLPMTALDIEACLSVKAPEVAHDVVFQRRLVML